VSIDAVDRSACGGTHVRTTAEIGAIMLRGTEKVRKATRVQFVCGARALDRARRDFESLGQIAAALSASPDDVASLIGAQAERAKAADAARKRLERELATYRARDSYENTQPDGRGIRTIVVRDAESIDDLRALAQAAIALPKVVVVGALKDPPSVLLASSEDSGVDAGRILKERLAAAGGRGGGSPRIAQGSLPDAAACDAIVATLVSRDG
jgi:alanyl-tRNA synthetase